MGACEWASGWVVWFCWDALWKHASIDTHHEMSLPAIALMAAHSRLVCVMSKVESWCAWNFRVRYRRAHICKDLQVENGLVAVDDALAQDHVERLGYC